MSQRKNFNNWAVSHARKENMFLSKTDLEPLENGGYRLSWLDSAWSAWKGKPKRAYNMPEAKRRSVYLDGETWDALKKLGSGNASAGIREAVRRAEERNDETNR